jgi:pilus assembly protein CpaB
MTRRIVTFVVAVLLAAIGAVGVLDYVHQADQRALNGMQAGTAYVAREQIPAGISAATAVDDHYLVSEQFPAASIPADAVRAITSSQSDLVLTSALAAGQFLLSPMLGASTATTSALPIPSGKVAITLGFCVQQAVANYIAPGAYIAIFNTFVNGTPVTGACGEVGASASTPHTRLVLANVQVLAVGEGTATAPSSVSATADGPTSSSSSSSSSSSGGGTIYLTLAVSQTDAELLIELEETGSPYLALETSASGSHADITFQP